MFWPVLQPKDFCAAFRTMKISEECQLVTNGWNTFRRAVTLITILSCLKQFISSILVIVPMLKQYFSWWTHSRQMNETGLPLKL
jgi:hypothetical protein